jgi:hypothetical protein
MRAPGGWAFLVVAAAAVVAAPACSGNQLPDATLTNTVDTATLGALDGAALWEPAAFDATTGFPVRTDQTSAFDFVYTIDELGRHVLIPLAALGLGSTSTANPGLQKVSVSFDALTSAPSDGYLTNDTLVINVGDVIAVRSRVACYLGVPQYAKLEIFSFDDSARTMEMQTLSDINCGYRGLQPGLPAN